jgi:hypothetical protein
MLFLFVAQPVFLPETFDPTGGVHQLLLTGEEGVAAGTNLHLDILRRRAGFYDAAAGTGYRGRFILGMNLCLHFHNL